MVHVLKVLPSMNKFKLIALVVLAICIAIFVVQERNAFGRLNEMNKGLKMELEQAREDVGNYSITNNRLHSLVAASQVNGTELARLRGEIIRLKDELTIATNTLKRMQKSSAHLGDSSNSSQTNFTVFTGSARATLPFGHTLVTGGWSMEPGKRTLAFFTPEKSDSEPSGSILIKGMFIQVPEAILSGTGWESFKSVTSDATQSGVLEGSQAQSFLESLKKMEGVDILSAPRLQTSTGVAGTISIGQDKGSGMDTSIMPVILSDGGSVDLTVSNALRRLP